MSWLVGLTKEVVSTGTMWQCLQTVLVVMTKAGMLSAFNGLTPGILLNIPDKKGIVQPNMTVMTELRNPEMRIYEFEFSNSQ